MPSEPQEKSILLWMLIYLLPAFLSSDAKASTAGGFYSLSITPIPVPIPRTAQLPEVVTLGVPKAWEGNTGVQELNLRERAGTVGLGVGLSSCHKTGTSAGTVSLFPACWDAFKKPQLGGVSEPDLPNSMGAACR